MFSMVMSLIQVDIREQLYGQIDLHLYIYAGFIHSL